MELDFWVRVFDRLLPRSRAWALVIERTLKELFHGFGVLPDILREHIGSILLEAFPGTTTFHEDWSVFFGAPETLTDEELLAEWGAFGGQEPRYIQDILQGAGFNVWVHEWWVPGSAPPIARNPIPLVPTSRVLVNDIIEIRKLWTHQFGDGWSQFKADGSIFFGNYDGYYLAPKIYPTPDIPAEYPCYFYVCDEVWPQYALVPKSKLRTLIRLIYKLKPVHLRCILRVTTFDDIGEGDIQDVWQDEDEIQDMVSAPDDIQDIY